MALYLSGIQPTGKFHIGNYFGCIKPFMSIKHDKASENTKNIFLIADMHCYTKPEKASNVEKNVYDAVRSLLAAGVDPERTHIVQQSKILEHANLSWYLSCLTKYSRAVNMTQFKSINSPPNVGLLIYPILQAADILIYSPDFVFVGPDQKQHLELASELCEKANNFTKSFVFKRPQIINSEIKIKSFKDGETKMSKSEPENCLFLLDEPEIIDKKIMRAKTDSFHGIYYDKLNRKALANLIEIYSLLRHEDEEAVAREVGSLDHFQFKKKLSMDFGNYFSPFRESYKNINESFIKEIIREGTNSASKMASEKLSTFLDQLNK